MPFGAPGAFWALLGPRLELRHTPYDLVDAAERLGRTEFPQAATFDVRRPPTEAEMLEVLEGRSVSGIMRTSSTGTRTAG